jgi:hypothetical protein
LCIFIDKPPHNPSRIFLKRIQTFYLGVHIESAYAMLMPRQKASGSPDAQKLYEHVFTQSGFFTMLQANAAGYSKTLLDYYLRTHKIKRVARGIFVLHDISPSRLSSLMPLWLWSETAGIFSGETGLFLHQLIDELPTVQHMIVPRAWKRRRLTIPDGVKLFYEDQRPGSYQTIEAIKVMPIDSCIAAAIIAGISPSVVRDVTRRKAQQPAIARDVLAPKQEEPTKTPHQKFIEELNAILAEVGVSYRFPPEGGRPVAISHPEAPPGPEKP